MGTELKFFAVANYNLDGEILDVAQTQIETLDATTVEFFNRKLKRLSGDMELPLEGKMPGEFPHIDFRIGSDLNGAYVLYYLHDEVVFASLFLRGVDDVSEIELTQVFKFLLLDTNDEDEPTEEEIENVLSSTAFNFPAIEDRPVAYAVRFSQSPEENKECLHIQKMNLHLAAAFFSRP